MCNRARYDTHRTPLGEERLVNKTYIACAKDLILKSDKT